MTLALKQILSLVRLLHSETATVSIAAGMAAGWVLGLSPGFSLQSVLIWTLILCFRIQAGAAGITALVVGVLAWPLYGLFDWVGTGVLSAEGLRPLWTALYHMPIVPLTRFNDSVVMGSGIVALALSPLAYWAGKQAVTKYRVVVVTRVKASGAWKWFSATKLVQWYLSFEQMQ